MDDNMKLYFDMDSHVFSLMPINSNKVVFDTNQGEIDVKLVGHRGDVFRIRIRRIGTKAPKKEYVYADIIINDVPLLPLSLACRKAYIHYHFGEHEITFQQWGAGQTKNRSAHTIMQKDRDVKWHALLSKICYICNNYERWIVQEMEQLIVLLETNHKNKFWDISRFIEMARCYEVLAPSVIPVIHNFVDKYSFSAMKNIIDFISDHEMQITDMQDKIKCGDIIWNYIKDYTLGHMFNKIELQNADNGLFKPLQH